MGSTKKSDTKWLDEVIKRLDDNTGRTEKGLEEIRKELNGLGQTAARQAGTLEDHMRRTEAAEKSLELVSNRIQPLEKHVAMWAGAGKFLAIALAILGAATSILALLYKVFLE